MEYQRPIVTTSYYTISLYFGVFHKHGADDTRLGLKPPQFQVGAFKSLRIWCVRRAILLLLFYRMHYGDTAVQS